MSERDPKGPKGRPPVAPSGEETVPRGRREPGVVPAAPRATPSRTQRVLAGLHRDRRFTIGLIAVALSCTWGAWWLYSHGYEVLGVVAAVPVIPALLAAFFIRRAPCPKCGKPLTLIGITQCENCREYVRLDGSAVVLIGDGYIAEFAAFELNVPLPLVGRLVFPDDRCCVCGGHVQTSENIDVNKVIITVSHCEQHEKGVVWELGMVSEAVPTVTFKFKSFDYWRAVRQANFAHVRSGMWR